MATRGGPRSPKGHVKGGVRESSRKKDAPPRETLKQIDSEWVYFWSHVAHFFFDVFSIALRRAILEDPKSVGWVQQCL